MAERCSLVEGTSFVITLTGTEMAVVRKVSRIKGTIFFSKVMKEVVEKGLTLSEQLYCGNNIDKEINNDAKPD